MDTNHYVRHFILKRKKINKILQVFHSRWKSIFYTVTSFTSVTQKNTYT